MRNGLMAVALSVLAVVAVAGWARKPVTSLDHPMTITAAIGAQPTYYDQNGQPVYGSADPNSARNANQLVSSPVSTNEPCVPVRTTRGRVYDTVAPNNDLSSSGAKDQPAVYSAAYSSNQYVSDRYVHSIHRPVRVVSREYVSQQNFVQDTSPTSYTERNQVRGHVGRSKTKSAVIVAGSAGAGAAIGAVAGGGKGAGIGALSGGTAGFIYDRLTHDRR